MNIHLTLQSYIFLVTFPQPLAQHRAIFNPVEQCFSQISPALQAPLLFIHHTAWTSDRGMTSPARRHTHAVNTHKLTHTQIHKHAINSHKSTIHLSQTMDTLEHMLEHACAYTHTHTHTHLNARTLTHSCSYHICYRWVLLLLSPKWI